ITTLTRPESTSSFSNNLRTASSAPTDGSVGVVRTLIFQTPRFSSAATRSVKVPPISIPILIVFVATISFPSSSESHTLPAVFEIRHVTFGYLQLLISFQFIRRRRLTSVARLQ